MVRGRGQAVVTATGTASAMGRVAALMTAKSALTPLQHRMIGVGRALAAAAVALCAIVLAIGLGRGLGTELMVITAISLVVAAVPESLPAVVTLALALTWSSGQSPGSAAEARDFRARSASRAWASSARRCSTWARCWSMRSVTCWQGAWPSSRIARMLRISARVSPAAWASRMNASRAAAAAG